MKDFFQFINEYDSLFEKYNLTPAQFYDILDALKALKQDDEE